MPLQLPVDATHLGEGLNDEQRVAVLADPAPLLIVAGPGSGKTRVLTRRVAALLAVGVRPWEIAAVTFTTKAAVEMRERVEDLIGGEDLAWNDKPWVGTFHSWCVRLLRREYEAAGLPASFTITDADEAKALFRRVIADAGLELPKGGAGELGSLLSLARNLGMDPTSPATWRLVRAGDGTERQLLSRDVVVMLAGPFPDPKDPAGSAEHKASAARTMAALATDYLTRLARAGAIDFDGLLTRALALLERNPEVAARWHRRTRHLLVDEFQDTNPVQYRIVKALAGPGASVTVVGDADQAIYGFRGASAGVLSIFASDYRPQIVRLGRNYRSTTQVLEVCRDVIAPVPAQARPTLIADNGDGDGIPGYWARDDRDEAEWIARRLSKATGSRAILVRTHAQTRSLEEALTAAGLGYQIIGGLRFAERAEVRDMLAWLRVVVNPGDILAWNRAVTAPKCGLGEVGFTAWTQAALSDGLDMTEWVHTHLMHGPHPSIPNRSRGPILKAVERADQLRELCALQGPVVGLRWLLSDPDVISYLSTGREGVDRVANVEELASAAARFIDRDPIIGPDGEPVDADDPLAVTAAFVAAMTVSGSEEDSGSGRAGNPVQVMTIHAAKGREFDHVVVPGWEEGMLPHARAVSESDLHEERRLAFVACSRARRTLALTRTPRRMLFGELREQAPSSFCQDLSTVTFTGPGSDGRAPRPLGQANRWGSRPVRAAGRPDQPAARVPALGGSRPRPASATPPGPRLPRDEATPGLVVTHARYGRGVILEVGTTTAKIEFESSGVRILDLGIAPLQAAA